MGNRLPKYNSLTMEMIRNLKQLSGSDVDRAGGKASSLAQMIQAGFPVPPGFVLTTEAFKRYRGKAIPESFKEDVLKAFDQLGADRVAVRSSAVAEDSSSASWAGQFESFLNVGRSDLIDKILACWHSASNERVQFYAKSQGSSQDQLALAVVVQKMVESQAAGVMFTVNPVTGAKDQIMIEAVYGLGELLVQGMATPDNYLIDKNDLSVLEQSIAFKDKMMVYAESGIKEVGVTPEKQDDPALDSDQLNELAELGIKIEQHYGKPQDIEWTVENDHICIVQSRPVTTMGSDEKSLPEGSIAEVTLQPLPSPPEGVKYALTVPQSVLFADLSLQGSRREFFAEAMGIDYEPAYIAVDAGGAMSWNYDQDDDFNKALVGDGSVAAGVRRFVESMGSTSRKLLRRSSLGSNITRRKNNAADIMEDLEEYWHAYKLHMTSLFSFWNAENLLIGSLTAELQKAGLEDTAQQLEELVRSNETNQFSRERSSFSKIVKRFGVGKNLTAKTAPLELVNALRHHAREFGFLLAPFNLGVPPTLESLLERVNDGSTPTVSKGLKKSSALKLPGKLKDFDSLVQSLTFWKNERLDVLSMADAEMEELYGSAAKALKLPIEELFLMTGTEIKQSLEAGQVVVGSSILSDRKQAYCLALYKGSVKFYQPSVAKTAVRLDRKTDKIVGAVASRGVARGYARIIRNTDDAVKLKPGEILVTHMTRPEYGAALDRAAAFVTDEGGMMSHAAIISREMKKPCIIGTRLATQVLKDGDMVEVNANAGIIKIVLAAN